MWAEHYMASCSKNVQKIQVSWVKERHLIQNKIVHSVYILFYLQITSVSFAEVALSVSLTKLNLIGWRENEFNGIKWQFVQLAALGEYRECSTRYHHNDKHK